MNHPRYLRETWNRRLRFLGAAGFVLACISIAANVAVIRYMPRPAPSEATGITRWSQLEPDRPEAFAANLRTLGAPETVIEALRQKTNTEQQAPVVGVAVSVVPAPAGFAARASTSAGTYAVSPVTSQPAAQSQYVQQPVGEVAVSNNVTPTAAVATEVHPAWAARNVSTPGVQQSAGAAVAYLPLAPGRAMASGAANSDTSAAGAQGGANAGASDIVAPSDDSQIPLAFEPLSPGTKLTEKQKKQVEQVQNEFATNSGGSNSAPADSKQWSDALVSADDQFRALFGEDAYFAQQLQAMRHGRAAKSTAQ